ERRGRPADRPLAEVTRGGIPHRDLSAVGDNLELRGGVVLEAHAAGSAHIERALHDTAVGIGLHEARLQGADRVDVALDLRSARLGRGAGRREDKSEEKSRSSKDCAHDGAYGGRFWRNQASRLMPRPKALPNRVNGRLPCGEIAEEPSMHVGMAAVFQN